MHEVFWGEAPFDDVEEDSMDIIFDYKLALLFPLKGEQPELIWVEVKVDGNYYNEDWERDLLDRPSSPTWEKHEIPYPSEEHITPEFNLDNYARREVDAGHYEYFSKKSRTFQVFWPSDDSLLERGDEIGNQCLERLNSGYSFTAHHGTIRSEGYNGNQVVMRYEQVEDDRTNDGKYYHDINLTDFRLAFDHFTRENNTFEGGKPGEFYIRRSMDWVKVVQVSTDDETCENRYEEMEFTKDHEIFSKFEGICSVAEHMRFPLSNEALGVRSV